MTSRLPIVARTEDEFRDKVYEIFASEVGDIDHSFAEISDRIEHPISAFPSLGRAPRDPAALATCLANTFQGDSRFEVLNGSPPRIKIHRRLSQRERETAELRKLVFRPKIPSNPSLEAASTTYGSDSSPVSLPQVDQTVTAEVPEFRSLDVSSPDLSSFYGTSMVGTQQPSVGNPIIARTEMEFCDKVHEFFSSTHDVDVNIRTISQRITSPANVSEKDRLSILHQDTRFDVIDFNIGVVRIIKKNGRGASSS